ncbi:hypothetical protein KDA_14500 [Dictyobacter alpinus]|uniref:Uncharacterized protein n=1 Tax=Dictyobacter alpinus TaxID=2014873 RepID=A0A402B3P5_9CHLR|nr:hypothetical protein [Dictyobacter alpinus]GCE25966.1 hypothetical protein KDA_14500 [Dictyobacter alpinus]
MHQSFLPRYKVVSRGIREPRMLRAYKEPYQLHRGASKAIWPTSVQHCVHTGQVAQQRRRVIMTGINWIDTLGLFRLQGVYILSKYITLSRMLQSGIVFTVIGVAFILTAIYDWAMLLNHWITFVLFAALCVVTTAVVDYIRTGRKPQHKASQPFMQAPNSSFAGIPISRLGQPLRLMNTGSSIPQTQVPGLFHFPDTPMPATPLVRVLETIDLSSTNVKHFLDIKPHATITRDVDGRVKSKNITRSQ